MSCNSIREKGSFPGGRGVLQGAAFYLILLGGSLVLSCGGAKGSDPAEDAPGAASAGDAQTEGLPSPEAAVGAEGPALPEFPMNSGEGGLGLGGAARSGWMNEPALKEWTAPVWSRETLRGPAWAPGIVKPGGAAADSPAEEILILPGWHQTLEGWNPYTGERLWRCLLPGMPLSRPIAAGGSLYVLTANGYLAEIESAGGRMTLTPWDKEPIQSGIVSDGGRLFFAAGGELLAQDRETGKILWRQPAEGLQRLTLNRGVLAAAGPDRTVLRQTMDGKEILVWEEGGSLAVPPILMNGKIFAALSGGEALCLDADTGRQIWRTGAAGPVVQILLTRKLLLRAEKGGRITAFHRGKGGAVWERQFSSGIGGMSAVPGAVYVSCRGGELYALHPGEGGRDLWMEDTGGILSVAPLPWKEGVLLSGEGEDGSGRLILLSQAVEAPREGKGPSGGEGASGGEGNGQGQPAVIKADGKVRQFRMEGKSRRFTIKMDEAGRYNVYSPTIAEDPLWMVLMDDEGRELATNFEHSEIRGGFLYTFQEGKDYTLRVESPGRHQEPLEFSLVVMQPGRS